MEGPAPTAATRVDLGSSLPFSQLDAATLERLVPICQLRAHHPGQTLVVAGDRPNVVGFVLSGILRIEKVLPDGRRHIVGLLVEGDMFGRIFDGPMPYSIEAAAETLVALLRRGPFEDLILTSPDLERLVIQEILGETDRTRDWMIVLGYQRIRTRVCAFLILLCTRYRHLPFVMEGCNTLLVQLPISRQDMAHLLGTRPESISRALHALQDDALIRLVRPDLIAIRDLTALAQEAGEDETALLGGQPQLLQRHQAGQRSRR